MAKRKKNKARSQQRRQAKQQQAFKSKPPAAASVIPIEQQPLGAEHSEMGTTPGNTNDNKLNQQMIKLERFQVLFNGALAVCAFVALFVGGGQLWIMSNQIEQAKQTINQMKFEQRAWIQLEADANETAPGHMMGTFDIQNTGHIPATIKVLRISSGVVDPNRDPDNLLKCHEEESVAMMENNPIAPNEPFHVPLKDPFFASEKMMKDIKSGQADFFIFATIEYTDAIELKGETRRCWIYSRKFGKMITHYKYNYMK